MGRIITVEWFRFQKDGRTCQRCTGSRDAIARAVQRAEAELARKQVAVDLQERFVDESAIDRSNTVTVDGKDVMSVLGGRPGIYTYCRSCSELTGRPAECHAFIWNNRAYECIPEDMLFEAIMREASRSG